MILIDKESLIKHMRKVYKRNTEIGFKWDLKCTVAVIEAEDEYIDTRATNSPPIKRVCKEHGIMCELATESGYCKITGCVHRTIHYGAKMEEVEE